MFGSATGGANAYAKVGVETGVSTASPHKLIVMLFDGALVAVSTARYHMQNGDIAAKGAAISKAIAIIDNGLRASLDRKVGGDIAANLDALYDYMGRRLLAANIGNQSEILDEVHRLLQELKGAWDAIGSNAAVRTEQPAPSLAPNGGNPSMSAASRLVKA